jgi:hypothetical protein
MLTQIIDSSPLNDTQIMLLKLFSRPMSPQELESLRKILLDYYDNLMQKEVDLAIEQKGLTREDFDKILNKQQRTH